MKNSIPFNKPFLHGKELVYISEAVASGKISGDGIFTKKCQALLSEKFNFKKVLLTTSCTDALEMAAILLNISEGDEVIVPSFTFVSSANAFVLRGAKIIFADSSVSNPNIDPMGIEPLITSRTKAIVVVHYAGVSCDMGSIIRVSRKYDIPVVEDAAQAIDSYFNDSPLGGIGDLGTFSFHETKNIISGEGGALVINNEKYLKRAEIIWEKGTNRSAFFRGEVDKYGWVDVGSSFLPSELTSAYLLAQLEEMNNIQNKRKLLWERYRENLKILPEIFSVQLPHIPRYATNNAHMFYLVCKDIDQRTKLISHLKNKGIHAVFHYLSLHSSPYYQGLHDGRELCNSIRYSDCLLRLPMYFDLSLADVDLISSEVILGLE